MCFLMRIFSSTCQNNQVITWCVELCGCMRRNVAKCGDMWMNVDERG